MGCQQVSTCSLSTSAGSICDDHVASLPQLLHLVLPDLYDCSVPQLAAGSEHIINGRTVRINLAGPRPDQMQQQLGLLQNDFLPQPQNVAWPGQQQQQQQQQQAVQSQQAIQSQQGAAWPVSPGKIASGVSSLSIVPGEQNSQVSSDM